MAREETLVETPTMVKVEAKILENNAVVVKGHTGSGKSTTIRHVAIQLQNENGFQIIPADSANQVKKNHDPIRKQVFVLDDIFGKSCTIQSSVAKWQSSSKDIAKLLNENTKILIACNSNILDNFREQKIFLFDETEDTVVDLHSKEEGSLSNDQRKKIADIYLGENKYDEEILTTETEYFPLLCQMYASNSLKKGNMKLFFEMNICNHIYNDKTTCAVLCLFVIFNNEVSEVNANSDVLQKLSRKVGIKPSLTWENAKTRLDDMSNSYVTIKNSQYKINNNKIFNLLLAYYGQDMFFSFVLNNSCSNTIRDRFRLQSAIKGVDECCIDVTPENEVWYFKRLLKDIKDGNGTHVFNNKQLSDAYFRNKLIIRIKQNPNSSDVIDAILSFSHTKESPLLMASQKGFLDLVKFFIEIKMNVNVIDYEENTPVYLASANGFKDIVKILLSNKCDVNIGHNITPLYIAIKNNHIAIAEELLKNNADPNHYNFSEDEHKSKIMELYKDTSSLCIANRIKTKRTALYIASLKGRKECAELLLRYGADPNMCSYYNVSPLYAAAEEGYIEIVDLLLKNGANVHEETFNKGTPLHVASEKGHKHIIKRLLAVGALIDATDEDGTTPLLVAIKNMKKRVVKLLIEEKADPNRVNRYGNFPLRESVWDCEICQLLLDNNADPNLVNDKQECALLVASEKNKIDSVMLLLERNADPNKKTFDQRSPLLVAVEENNTNIVRALLRSGANPNDKNQSHQSVLSIASTNKNKEISKMIKKAKKGILPQKTIEKRMPDLKNKPKESIQETSYSGKKLELTPKQQVRKQNFKENIHVKRHFTKIRKTSQKQADVVSDTEIRNANFGEHNIAVIGTKIHFNSKLSRKSVAVKPRKIQKSKVRVTHSIEVEVPKVKPPFRP